MPAIAPNASKWTRRLKPRSGNDEVRVAGATVLTPESSGPVYNRHRRAVMRDLLGNLGLDPVTATFAPSDELNMSGQHLAEGRQHRRSIVAIACYQSGSRSQKLPALQNVQVPPFKRIQERYTLVA
jgi:hypothetical protein